MRFLHFEVKRVIREFLMLKITEQNSILGITIAQNKSSCWIFALFLIGLISRIIPHAPNATAMIFISVALGSFVPRLLALFLVLATLISADLILAWHSVYSVFGYWSLLTYSGFILVVFMGSFLKRANVMVSLLCLLSAAPLFWLWTNLGVWLGTGIYPHTPLGLLNCYSAALPFLQTQWSGDVCWAVAWLLFARMMSQHVTKHIGKVVKASK